METLTAEEINLLEWDMYVDSIMEFFDTEYDYDPWYEACEIHEHPGPDCPACRATTQ